MYFAGIDIGSTMTKVVLTDKSSNLLSAIKGPTGPEHRQLANEVMQQALEQASLQIDDISYIVATGYGRFNVPFADRQITELSCHARGVFSLFPNVRTAIDIGGQDAKCMKIDNGRLINFVMNDKCAAGTGRFLEVTAVTLGIKLEDMGSISLKATKQIQISNLCTIFAQQEVVALLSHGEKLENILAGLHDALANRIAALARRLGIEPDLVLTGGVAKNSGMVKAMKENLDCEILVPEEPLLTGALGAAILAKEIYMKAMAAGEALPTTSRRLEKATFF
ncbi:MAG TPA: acyl-CoA dehydratase activase, partial [Dehalococcoidia bacterium]|nr:acyl-CoA dehydratase activase [Dehalococcoidia bacterium]